MILFTAEINPLSGEWMLTEHRGKHKDVAEAVKRTIRQRCVRLADMLSPTCKELAKRAKKLADTRAFSGLLLKDETGHAWFCALSPKEAEKESDSLLFGNKDYVAHRPVPEENKRHVGRNKRPTIEKAQLRASEAQIAAAMEEKGEAPAGAIYFYVRVSSENQRDYGHGIEEQIHRLRQWAEHKGVEFDPSRQLYKDEAESGAKPFSDRPAGFALAKRLRRGDTIVAPDIKRIFRNFADGARMLEQWIGKGVRLVLLDFGGHHIDTSNPMSLFFLRHSLAMSALERDIIKDRTTAGMRRRTEKGGLNGWKAPHGFRLKKHRQMKWIIVPDERAIWQMRVARRLMKKHSARETAEIMNEWCEDGKAHTVWETKGTCRIPWDHGTIRNAVRSYEEIGKKSYSHLFPEKHLPGGRSHHTGETSHP